MAINPPSDIVLDVMRAADPGRNRVATERLAGLAQGGTAGADFTEFMGVRQPMSLDQSSGRSLFAGGSLTQTKVPGAYKSFEAFFLQSFIENMLPKSSEMTYGSGTAGDVWRSLAAQQMGDVFAASGGIGIAEKLAQQAAARGDSPAADSGAEFSLSASISAAHPYRDWASYLPYLASPSGSSDIDGMMNGNEASPAGGV